MQSWRNAGRRFTSRFGLALFLCVAVAVATVAGFALIGGSALPAKANGNVKELRIAAIPTQAQGKLQKAMNKLAAHLTDELNIPAQIKVYADYQAVLVALEHGDVDMAYLGPLTYVIAHDRTGVEAIVTQLIEGKPFYYSLIIAPKSAPWDSLDEFLKQPKQRTFAYGDPESTSGSLIPKLTFKRKGVDPVKGFKTVIHTGGHDATSLAVQYGQVDAGAVDSAIYAALVKNGKVDAGKIKVIYTSEPLFQYPWAVHKDISPDLRRRIQEAFLKVKDAEILDVFGSGAFTKASDADYEAIRQAAREFGMLPSR